MDLVSFEAGGYRFIASVFQYSAGVAAEPGHRLVRVTFRAPLPLEQGFARIREILGAAGRPLTTLCACELRSPAPFTEEGFRAFNETYVRTLQAWGLYDGRRNAVARSNVCPALAPPPVPSFHAFTYSEPSGGTEPASFVISGSAEAPEGRGNYRDHIVRRQDISPEGLREKARWVLAEMERRLAALGFSWADATATNVYTVHDIHPFLADEIVQRGAARSGLTWHYCQPPVRDLEFEMDCRGVARDYVVD